MLRLNCREISMNSAYFCNFFSVASLVFHDGLSRATEKVFNTHISPIPSKCGKVLNRQPHFSVENWLWPNAAETIPRCPVKTINFFTSIEMFVLPLSWKSRLRGFADYSYAFHSWNSRPAPHVFDPSYPEIDSIFLHADDLWYSLGENTLPFLTKWLWNWVRMSFGPEDPHVQILGGIGKVSCGFYMHFCDLLARDHRNMNSWVTSLFVVCSFVKDVEICQPWINNVGQQVDFAFNCFFLVHFILRVRRGLALISIDCWQWHGSIPINLVVLGIGR